MSYMPPPAAAGMAGDGRCGMCSACGAMPPWAPEMLKDASPAARRALFERMREKQSRFIVERDTRLRQAKLQNSDDSKQGERSQEGQAQSAASTDDSVSAADAISDRLPPADEIPLQIENASATGAESDSTFGNGVQESPITERASPGTVPSSESSSSSSVTQPTDEGVSPKRKPSRRAVVIDPHPERTAQRESNPSMSSASLRSNDSDADSFHTAEETDRTDDGQKDTADLEEVRLGDDSNDLPSERVSVRNEESDDVEWQAFEGSRDPEKPVLSDETVMGAGESDGSKIEKAGSEPLRDTAVNNGQSSGSSSSGPIPTLTMLQLSPGESLTSIPSDNLEESVSARRRPARGHSRQNSLSRAADYIPPAHIVPLQHADAVPHLKCEDCEKWRTRVEELQLKVETLTSALAARDMECASLRAKSAGKLREPTRNESRLIQECDSLRVTTEFLYQKLERYERKAHIGIGDVH